VPSRWPAIGEFLQERTWHDFPVLARLRSNRVRRSIASILPENLDTASSVIGVKVLTGAVFAEIVRDSHLADNLRALACRADVDAHRLDDAIAFAGGDDARLPAGSPMASAALT
jgi:hypothetical protein